MRGRHFIRLYYDRFQVVDRISQRPVLSRDTLAEARAAATLLNLKD